MAADNSVTPQQWLAKQIQTDDPDVLRSMVKTMAEALMAAEADTLCGAPYGERSNERTDARNGYRRREWDTRAGTVAVAKLREVVLNVRGETGSSGSASMGRRGHLA
ncbi:transposase, partial [Nonomuraea sp. NPDC049758]|uniref:transposase n=1 Tax=Nonomuraea sp. NPDC049758 TaxID=3154360 RepID=UPI00343AB92B